jgi:hypothetical protein
MPLKHAAWAMDHELSASGLFNFSISKSQHFSIYPKKAFHPDAEGLKWRCERLIA